MKLEAITRLIKTKETVEFTLQYLKLSAALSFFCLVTVYLFDEEGKSVIHSVIVTSSSCFTAYSFETKKMGYNTAIALSFINDFICLDLAFDKFQSFSYMFLLIAHQLFIQGCIFNAYPKPFGNIIIVFRTSLWLYFSFQARPAEGSIPTEMPCCFVYLVTQQIFLVNTLDKKANREIETRLGLEYQINFLKSIFHELTNGILVLDRGLICKFKNKAYEDLFKNDEFLDIYKNSDNHITEILNLFESSQNQVHVGKFFVKDIKFSCNASRVEIEDEKFLVFSFSRIIFTGKVDKELEIANMLQELSHDLKTPLNAIINEQREVIESCGVNEKSKVHLLKSFNTSMVLLSFIQDIIDYSNLNSDLLMVKSSFFDVKNLIEDCCEYVKYAFMKNCRFSIDSSVSKMLYFDKNKLRQIIIGIFYTLYNSCPSGEIKLFLIKSVFELKFIFRVSSESPRFRLIPAALESLKFRITQEIVSKLAGVPLKITKSDEICEYSIELNIRTEWESVIDCDIPSEATPIVPTSLFKSLIVEYIDFLIVDDIEINCEMLKRTLQGLFDHCKCQGLHERRYSVHSVTSGKDAIQLIQLMNQEKRGYRIVFMDCQMPELDGWETSKIINSMFEEKSIFSLPYIIAYTAYDSGNDIKSYQRAGMSDHLNKPCIREELCEKVQYWLAKPLRKL
jgi:CheY-like chemotaxis protein